MLASFLPDATAVMVNNDFASTAPELFTYSINQGIIVHHRQVVFVLQEDLKVLVTLRCKQIDAFPSALIRASTNGIVCVTVL